MALKLWCSFGIKSNELMVTNQSGPPTWTTDSVLNQPQTPRFSSNKCDNNNKCEGEQGVGWSNYTRLQKRWHATSVYNERWDSAKSYPNFPGRKRFIMRKDFPWIMREVNHWLCICANISHKGVGSCRSWIKLIRCQRFCNRVYM